MKTTTTQAPQFNSGATVTNQEWRAVVGFEGRYEVSRNGEIRSLLKGKVKDLKVHTRKADGYKIVTLYDSNKKHHRLYVHRIVGQAFISNPYNLPCINHIDTNTGNNNVENLEWTSVWDNNHHPLTLEHRKEWAKSQRINIRVYRDGKYLYTSNYIDLNKNLGVSISTLKFWTDDNKTHLENYSFERV